MLMKRMQSVQDKSEEVKSLVMKKEFGVRRIQWREDCKVNQDAKCRVRVEWTKEKRANCNSESSTVQ